MFTSRPLYGLLVATALGFTNALSLEEIFARPVMSRVFQTEQYALSDKDAKDGVRANISEVASSLADLKPSCVSETYRFAYGDNVTEEMIEGWNTIRSAVLAKSPNAKFDIELNLDPKPTAGHKTTYPNAQAVVNMMKYIDSKIHVDAWFFDFLSTAESNAPNWVDAVVHYAHIHNQTVGGNVFGHVAPPNVDVVSFTDGQDESNQPFGYGIDETKVAARKKNISSSSTMLLGHLNNNPQNNPNTTLSCVYINEWNATRRADYQNHWIDQQKTHGFTYMLPLFFPLCPGAYSHSPLDDTLPGKGAGTVYDRIRELGLQNDK